LIKLSLVERGKGNGKTLKESETSYRVLSSGEMSFPLLNVMNMNSLGIPYSLLELELGTGRMHQIRRHLAGIGCPLLGDDKYGDFSLNKKLKAATGLKHLLLHASRLVIPPCEMLSDGLDISAPVPDFWHPIMPVMQ
jgi:23S rRNA pseudouridine955/2504/2580 synthase